MLKGTEANGKKADSRSGVRRYKRCLEHLSLFAKIREILKE
jgi:hypothetical protein